MTALKTILQLLLLIAKPIVNALESKKKEKRLENEQDDITKIRRNPYGFFRDGKLRNNRDDEI